MTQSAYDYKIPERKLLRFFFKGQTDIKTALLSHTQTTLCTCFCKLKEIEIASIISIYKLIKAEKCSKKSNLTLTKLSLLNT